MIITKIIVFSVILIAASVIDWRQHIIPNWLILAGLAAGILFALLSPSWYWLIGALVGFALMLVLYLVFPGSTGEGDVKLAAVIGLFLGYPLVLNALVMAYILGGTVAVILLITRRVSLKSKISFGPFLAGGAGVVIIACMAQASCFC